MLLVPFMFKILEKVVSAQLRSFLQKNYISMKNFSPVSGPTIEQKLHLLK